MRRLVEEVGEPLRAGALCRYVKATGLDSGILDVGDREVKWELADDAVNVRHPPADRRAAALHYSIGLVFTALPTQGLRWWWACPSCGERVDVLYLLSDRDRLACRECCRLLYRSQYGQKRRRRKRRPAVVVVYERQVWTQAAGLVVSRRTVRR